MPVDNTAGGAGLVACSECGRLEVHNETELDSALCRLISDAAYANVAPEVVRQTLLFHAEMLAPTLGVDPQLDADVLRELGHDVSPDELRSSESHEDGR